MRQANLTIINPLGLHARAASKLVDTAKNFAANATLLNEEGVKADTKRIMNLLLLGAPMGSKVELVVEGKDEDEAFAAISTLISAGFHEMDGA